MNLKTCTDEELVAMLAYERNVESKRRSVQRVQRSARRIQRLEAELGRRGAHAMTINPA